MRVVSRSTTLRGSRASAVPAAGDVRGSRRGSLRADRTLDGARRRDTADGDDAECSIRRQGELLRKRIEDVIAYQDAAYATRYANKVRMAIIAERPQQATRYRARPSSRNLHKVMTYKDEYEVARLLVQDTFAERVRARLRSVSEVLLQLAAAVAARRSVSRTKLRLGRWFTPALRALAAARFLRGTAFDPFG